LKAKALVRLQFPTGRHLEIVYRALKPEIERPTSLRSKENLEKKGPFLILKVEAKDTVALRASLNANLRWINSIVKVYEILKA
jgi:tRNA threonylcarbamoyladenosine modification (KEOPS) complex  Pcc1 subunit